MKSKQLRESMFYLFSPRLPSTCLPHNTSVIIFKFPFIFLESLHEFFRVENEERLKQLSSQFENQIHELKNDLHRDKELRLKEVGKTRQQIIIKFSGFYIFGGPV